MKSLWQFLHIYCVALTVGSSLAPARIVKGGFVGYALGLCVGLAVGVGCAWAMWNAGEVIGARIRRLSESVHERYFWLLYIGAMFWIALSGFIGFWASRGLLRLVL
jgi:hypothetical protein